MKTYNGHRSWNAWNISLWIGNTESTYNFAIECISQARQKVEADRFAARRSPRHKAETILTKAVNRFMAAYRGTKTPDGAIYNALSVKLALEGYMNG